MDKVLPPASLMERVPIPLDLPGLDQFAPELPDGRLLVLEGGPDPAKGHLALAIARAAALAGRGVELWTTREGPETPVSGHVPTAATALATVTTPSTMTASATAGPMVRDVAEWPSSWPVGRDVVVDSFSLLCLEASPGDVARRVRGIRESCKASGSVSVVVLDDGHLGAASRAVIHHLADGIVQFQVRDDPEGPLPFLRIPKWMGGPGAPKNLFYGFDGENILIDTRRRVN